MSEDVIKELIKTGVITQEIADEARMKVDKTLQACAFALHALMCNKEHEHNPEMLMQPGVNKCLWYAEQTAEHTWGFRDHSFWLRQTIDIIEEQEIEDSDGLLKFTRELGEVASKVKDLIVLYPNFFKALREVIET